MADLPFVRVERRGACAWVHLDRPPLNLIVPEMIRSLTAAQALEWGLVNRVAPLADLERVTTELVDRVLQCGPAAVRLQKELIIRWRNTDLRTAVEYGVNAFAQAYATEEPREATRAFL